MVPDRLSYTEMYYDMFKYPEVWTHDYDTYTVYRPDLCRKIIEHMDNYSTRISSIRKQAKDLHDNFFSANELLRMVK